MPPLSETGWDPHGFTIFCDDIRDEVTGKVTYVGVYANVMFLTAQLPAVVPSLSVVAYLYHAPDARFDTLTLRAALPGDAMDAPSIKMEIPPTAIPSNIVELDDYGDTLSHPRRILMFRMNITPLTVQRYGRLRISALWDDKFVPLGSLLITPPPTPKP